MSIDPNQIMIFAGLSKSIKKLTPSVTHGQLRVPHRFLRAHYGHRDVPIVHIAWNNY